MIRELGAYRRVRKRWWLLPIILVLLLVGGLLVPVQGSPPAPFVYTIFRAPASAGRLAQHGQPVGNEQEEEHGRASPERRGLE